MQRASWRERPDFLVAVLLTVWIIGLHLFTLAHAGGLWRDEVGSVDFATMPTWADIWRNLRYDNFPPLFVLLLRGWTSVGFTSDIACRIFGFIMGMGLLGAIWFSARRLGRTFPVLALALCAANPILITMGDTVRPYALALGLNLFMLTSLWQFAEAPNRRNFWMATLFAILGVQCIYQNAFFLFIYACGGWVVAARRRDQKTAVKILLIGVMAALSLVPYLKIIAQGQEWIDVLQQPIHFDRIFSSLWDTLQGGNLVNGLVWLILILLAGGLVVIRRRGEESDRLIYCATVLALAIVIYLVFLRFSHLPPRPWYFFILLVPGSVLLETIFSSVNRARFMNGRCILSVMLVLVSLSGDLNLCRERRTNIDLIAKTLKENARPEDLVVVTEFFYGVTLQRYLNTNRWIGIPPLAEYRIHRYDLLKTALASTDAIDPLLEKITRTIESGHRVWSVGALPKPGQTPTPGAARRSFPLRVSQVLGQHVSHVGFVDVPTPNQQPVSPYENVPLMVFEK